MRGLESPPLSERTFVGWFSPPFGWVQPLHSRLLKQPPSQRRDSVRFLFFWNRDLGNVSLN